MRSGILLALASAVLFGASTPFAKLLLGMVDPWLMAGLLYIGAGVGLAIVHLSRGVLRLPAIEAPLRRPDVPWLAAVILFGGVLGPLLLMLGLARSDAAAASLLLNLEGLATMGIAWVVFRENVDRRLLLGAFAILAGAVLVSWQGHANFEWSGLLIAGACLCWGIDNNLTRKLSSSDPVQIAMLKGLVAGAVNLALALWQGAAVPPVGTLAAAGVVGFLGYGLSLALFVLGLRHLGAARTGAYFSLAPFVGAVLAVLVLGEPLSGQLIIAGALMGVGLWLHIWPSGTSMSISTSRWSTSIGTITMSITNTVTLALIHRESRMRTDIGTPGWCIVTPTIPTCITAMGIAMPDGNAAQR